MKRTRREKNHLKLYILTIIGLLGMFGYKMYYYWPKIFDNYAAKSELENDYLNLLDEEEKLSGEILKLQDPEYIARFAREKYLYSKNGEIIIRIMD